MIAIPKFPEFRLISFEDKPQIEKFLGCSRQEMSECTFAGLYIWRETFQIGFSEVDSALLARTMYPDGRQSCLVPFCAEENIDLIKNILVELKGVGGKYPYPGMQKGADVIPEFYFSALPSSVSEKPALVRKMESAEMSVAPDRDNWDYVYLVKDLVALAGTKYHSKKKALNKCLSNYKCTFEPMSPKILKECIEFQQEWCMQINCDEYPGLLADSAAVMNALKEFEKLGLFGGVVRIGGKINAMTIAERLNGNTAVIHFEKATPSIDGLYQVINNWFCREMLGSYEFVNREQDLGDAGLRKAKTSYNPHHMVEKYVAKLKQ